MTFCGGCGAPQVPGDRFCQRCGRAYSTDEPPQPSVEPSVVQPVPTGGTSPTAGSADADDEPFPGWAGLAAAAAVIVAPFISLIAALAMRSSEQRPSRRSFLKSWAIWSGVWLGTGFVIVLIAFGALASGSGVLGGGCKGGPDTLTPPSYVSKDSKHWTAIVPCLDGGTKTRPATKSEERFLNSH